MVLAIYGTDMGTLRKHMTTRDRSEPHVVANLVDRSAACVMDESRRHPYLASLRDETQSAHFRVAYIPHAAPVVIEEEWRGVGFIELDHAHVVVAVRVGQFDQVRSLAFEGNVLCPGIPHETAVGAVSGVNAAKELLVILASNKDVPAVVPTSPPYPDPGPGTAI